MNNGLSVKKYRVAHWDNIKFAMITLMVVGHFVDLLTDRSDACRSIYLFIYAFHMPVLFFISGLFFKITNLRKKVIYYISAGFALKILLSVVYLITDHSAHFSLLSDGGIPWFFFVLAFYQILMYLFRDANKTYLLIASIVLACFVGYDQSIGDFLYLSRTIIFFPFFLIGTMLTQEKVNYTITKNWKFLMPLAALCLAVWLYLSFFHLDTFYTLRHLFTGRNPFSDALGTYGPLARLLCYVITFMTGASAVILIPQRKIPFFTSLGAHTENVYFWHFGLMLLAERYMHITNLYLMSDTGKVCFLMLAIVMSIAIAAFGIFNYPLRTIRKACYKVDTNVTYDDTQYAASTKDNELEKHSPNTKPKNDIP